MGKEKHPVIPDGFYRESIFHPFPAGTFVKNLDHARVHRFSDVARNGSLVVLPDAKPSPQRRVSQKVSRHVFQASVQVTGPHPLDSVHVTLQPRKIAKVSGGQSPGARRALRRP